MKGVSIPMFSAKGLAIRRANGEVITPYYFALEDLQEDWEKLLEQQEEEEQARLAAAAADDADATSSGSATAAKKLPASPRVEIRDFVEVMCLSQGLSSDSLREHLTGSASSDAVATVASTAAAATSVSSLSEKQLKEAVNTPGIVPPRREIGELRLTYLYLGSINLSLCQDIHALSDLADHFLNSLVHLRACVCAFSDTEMIREYYRNEAGIKNEFQEARIR
jgi:hypothetical protein